MSARCSVVPQIWHKGEIVNSLLFTQLWDKAKAEISDSVKAREQAKSQYLNTFSPEFIMANGDWVTAYKAANGVIDSEFKLDDSSWLNEQGEPSIESLRSQQYSSLLSNSAREQLYNEGRYRDIKGDEIQDEDRMFLNRAMSQILIARYDKLSSIRDDDKGTIKDAVLKYLNGTVDKTKNEALGRFIKRLEVTSSRDWAMFVGYFNKKFSIRISDDMIEDDDNLTHRSVEGVTREYDGNNQLKQDLAKTAAAELKFELARSVYKNMELGLFFTEGNEGQLISKDWHGNPHPIEEYTPAFRYQLKDVPDMDLVWQQIIALNTDHIDKRSIIGGVEMLSYIHFRGTMQSFVERLRTDETFYNSFRKIAKLAVVDNVTFIIEPDSNSNSITYSDRINNRSSQPSRLAGDDMTNILVAGVESGLFKEYAQSLPALFKRPSSPLIYSEIENLKLIASQMGLTVTTEALVYYINFKNNLSFEVNADTFKGHNLETLPKNVKEIYAIELSAFKDKLRTLAVEALATQGLNIEGLKSTKHRRFTLSDEIKGTIASIATILSVQYVSRVDMSYYNASGEREYSPQLQSFLTDLFDGLVSGSSDIVSEELIKQRFELYTRDKRLYYDNLLWASNDDKSQGIFNYKTNRETGERYGLTLNKEFIKTLRLKHFSGSTLKNGTGTNYKDIKDSNWTSLAVIYELRGMFLLPSSDSPRIYGVPRKFVNYRLNVPMAMWESVEQGTHTGMFQADYDKDTLSAFHSSEMYRRLVNVFEQEFTDIHLTFDKVFDLKHFVDKGKVRLANYYTENGISSLHQTLESQISKDKYGNVVKDSKGNSVYKAIDKGKPTGNVFNKSNFTYVDKNGNLQSLKSFIESNGGNYLQEVIAYKTGNLNTMQDYLDAFMMDWLSANQAKTIKTLRNIKDDLLNATLTRSESNKRLREEGTRKKDLIEMDEEGNVFTEDTDTMETNYGKYMVSRIDTRGTEFVQESDAHKTASFNVMALELYVNHFLNSVSFGNLLYGQVGEFKGMVDWNKRVNQTIRNGATGDSGTFYKMLVMDNIMLKDMMLDLYDNKFTGTPEEIAIAKEMYKDDIDTTNAIDVITDLEFIERLKHFGLYDRYKTIIDDIQNSYNFNYDKYTFLIEQLKYFSYSKQFKEDPNQDNIEKSKRKGRVISYQNKNSTIVLFPRFIKGTEKEQLYNFMVKNGIGDINTGEGFKLGGIPPLRLHTPDGKLDLNQLETPLSILENHMVTQYHKDLRIQLDIVPHLKDKDGTIATQLLKKILTNIYNVDYKVNGKNIKGRTGNYADGKRGVFEELQYALGYNVEESARELLAEFGGLSNGKINYDGEGNIIVNVKKINQMVEKYFLDSNTDLNILKAVRTDKDGNTAVPYHHPMLLKLVESFLESKITNKVTRQKLDNVHAPIQPDMFNSFTIQQDKSTDTHITYTKEFLEQVAKSGTNKLRSEHWDKDGTFHPAQILLNPHDKKFFEPEFLDERGLPDINKIKAMCPEALMFFGIRIPYENAQSGFVAEIVGFLHTGATQAVTPDHLIAQTGWDFDIDTVYLYKYSTYLKKTYDKATNTVTSELKLHDTEDTSEDAITRRIDNYMRINYQDQYVASYKTLSANIRAANRKLKKITTDTQTLLNSRYRVDVINKISSLDKQIDLLNTRLESLRDQPNVEEEAFEIIKNLEDLVIQKNNFILTEDTHVVNDPNFVLSHGDRMLLSTTHAIQNSINKSLEHNTEAMASYVELRKIVEAEFKLKNNITRSTRAERNNTIVGSFITIHANKANFGNKKINDMEHMKTASNYINKILGVSTNNANPNDISDQIYFRNLNMNVSTLKEKSVAYDNILAILSLIGTKNVGTTVPGIISFDQIKDFKGQKDYAGSKQLLTDTFGKDNFEIDYTNKTIHIHNIGLIANNAVMTGLDIQGEPISRQRAELTANILDAVKQLMINLSDETFGIFAYLASTPLSYYTGIHTKGKAEVNRFIYPSLFVSQPIVQDLSEAININSKFGEKSYGAYNIKEVKNRYAKQLLDSIIGQGSFADVLYEYFDRQGKSRELKDSDISEHTERYGLSSNLNDEQYILLTEQSRLQYAKAATIIERYLKSKLNEKNNGEGTLNTDIDWLLAMINEYLGDNEQTKISDRAMTLEELSNNIEHGDTYSKDFNISQLSVLQHYELVSEASGSITSLMSVLNVDKKGVGPTNETTNILFNKLAKTYTNYEGIRGRIEAKLVKEFGKVKGKLESKKVMYDLEKSLNGSTTLSDKVEVIKVVAIRYGVKLDTLSPSLLTYDGQAILEAVYGSSFHEEQSDYTKSAIPYLSAQLIWGHTLSTNVYQTVSLMDDRSFKQLINNALYKLNAIGDDVSRTSVIMNVINKEVANIDFFNFDGTVDEQGKQVPIDYARLFGVVTPRTVHIDSQDIVGPSGETVTTKERDEMVWDMPEFESKSFFNNTGIAEGTRITRFKTLSLANQIHILKSSYNAKNELDKTFLNKRVSLNMNPDYLKEYGFITVSITGGEQDLNADRDAFDRMYNSKDPFIRIVAENLIRHAFIMNGLTFGENLSKYIPIDIFFNADRTDSRLARNYNDLSTIVAIQDDVNNFPHELDNEAIEHIHQAQWNNVVINPVMQPTYYNNKDGNKVVNKDRPTFTESPDATNNYLLSHIIVESMDKVNDSKYAMNDYLIRNIKLGNTSFPVLYKRSIDPIGDKFVYFPINRTLKYEYGTTFVPNYSSIPVDDILQDIATEADYMAALSGEKIEQDPNPSVKVIPKEGAYSTKVRELADKSDIVIHIGDPTSFEAKVTNASKDNATVVSEQDLIKRGINLNKFPMLDNAKPSILITGDKHLNTSDVITEAKVRKAIKKIITGAKFENVYTIKSSEDSVGAIIESLNNPLLQTEVTDYTDVQYSQSLRTVEVRQNTPFEEFAMDVSTIHKAQVEVSSIATRVYDSQKFKIVASALEDLADVVNKAQPTIEKINVRMTWEHMIELTKVNEKIYDFLNGKINQVIRDLDNIKINSLVDDNSYTEGYNFRNLIVLANEYLSAMETITNFPAFSTEGLTGEDITTITAYNQMADYFAKDKQRIDRYVTAIRDLNHKSLVSQILQKSSNPAFTQSVYSQVAKFVQQEGYDPSMTADIDINTKDMLEAIEIMLTRNDDIGLADFYLGSVRNTNVPLIDNIGKLYAEIAFNSHIQKLHNLKHFKDITSNLKPTTGVEFKDVEFSSSRAAYFKDRFLDDNGNLIEAYDMVAFNDKIDEISKSLEPLRVQVATIDLKLAKTGITAAETNDLNQQRKSIENSFKKANDLINTLSKKEIIKEGTSEYVTHMDFYLLNNPLDRYLYQLDNRIQITDTRNGLTIVKLVPSKVFINTRYERLTSGEKQFHADFKAMNKDIVSDIFTNRYVRDNFVPYSYKSTTIKQALAFLAISDVSPKRFRKSVSNENEYVIEAKMLQAPRVTGGITIPRRDEGESKIQHVARVLKMANANNPTVPFTSMEDIVEFNKKNKKEKLDKVLPYRNFDLINVMNQFINDMAEVKTIAHFEPAFKQSLMALGDDTFETSVEGGKFGDTIKSRLTGKRTVMTSRGVEGTPYQRFVESGPMWFKQSRTNTKRDVVLAALVRSTSLVTMGFNVRSGVKNAMAGYVNITTEAMSSQYFNVKEATQGTKDFNNSVSTLIAERVKSRTNQGTDNLNVGFIRFFGQIFEDHRDDSMNNNSNTFTKGLALWDNLAYISLMSGEMFLQFSTMFSMLRSHRIVDGQLMTISDFIGERKYKVIKDILTPDQRKSLDAHITNIEKKEYSNVNYVNGIRTWMNLYGGEVSKENKTKINETLAREYADAKTQFETFDVVRDQFELDKDGILTIKEGSSLTIVKAAMMMNRIRAVNHSLQGVYNRIDRSALQNNMMGEVILQFRKWMYPTWIRWAGVKMGKSTYSEALGNYTSGAYADWGKFVFNPLFNSIKRRVKKNSAVAAMEGMGIGYLEYLNNIKFYYNMLSKSEQANVRRTTAQIGALAFFSVLVAATAMGLGGADDDKKKNPFISWLTSNMLYTFSAIQTEVWDATPFGAPGFWLRTKKNVVPIEQTVTNISKAVYYGMIYPLQDPENRVYKTGIYKGESKAYISLAKVTPGLRQINTGNHLKNTINYYQMYNPMSNLLGVTGKHDDIKLNQQQTD